MAQGSKQGTLGKFFGNPNGTKSKTQSTLDFNRKQSTKNAGDKENSTPNGKDVDVEMKDDDDTSVNGIEQPKEASLSKGMKRDTTEDLGESEDSDDIPVPSKRRKVSKEVPSRSKQPKRSLTPTKMPQTATTRSSEPPASEDSVAESADENADFSVEEIGSGSEQEKPAIAPKKRKEIQAALKSSGDDLYPDWKAGEPVPYAALCTTFSKVEMTTKRLEIIKYCSKFLQQVLRLTPNDLLPSIQLMINKLAADYTGIELGIGESFIMKAIAESTGRTLADVKTDHNKIGDLGLVAAKSRMNQPTMFKPKALNVRGVHEGLLTIAKITGQGSQDRKIAGIKKLLSAADVALAGKGTKGVDITQEKGGPSEAKFLIRFLEGKLRLGLAERTVLVALSQAMVHHETARKGNKIASTDALEKGEATLKTVYSEIPSYEIIIPLMLQHGLDHLRENCKLQPGVPLKPMLAKPTKSITEVLDRFEGKDFTCEYKYDGERAQIHYVAPDSIHQYPSAQETLNKATKGLSAIFSRNSEDLSKKYPDIFAKLQTWIKPETTSFVLDCETVAWDVVAKKVLPFQQLMTRKRKDVKAEDVKIKVCVFAFDILFYNGEATVQRSLRERRELLHEAFTPVEGEFAFATYGNTADIEEIQLLLDESVKASCEGLMVKMLDTNDSWYEPSKRSRNWLKVKKDYLAGVGDSLDLVVLGAYFGKGKRTSVYGAFLLAAYNEEREVFETVCNIGTGFSEAILEELHKELSDLVIDKPKPFYDHSQVKNDQPDVWFEARKVWEVKTADLTMSPRYRAAIEEMGLAKGISLRFPRFIQKRDDKKPEEATTSHAVAEMYRKQEAVQRDHKAKGVDDDFEY